MVMAGANVKMWSWYQNGLTSGRTVICNLNDNWSWNLRCTEISNPWAEWEPNFKPDKADRRNNAMTTDSERMSWTRLAFLFLWFAIQTWVVRFFWDGQETLVSWWFQSISISLFHEITEISHPLQIIMFLTSNLYLFWTWGHYTKPLA